MAFVKGQSGNPRGRPPGSRHKTTLLIEALLEDGAREVAKRVLAAAKGGDLTAAKIVLERLIPPARERTVELLLPSTDSPSGISEAFEVVLNAAADGLVTLSEAKQFADLLEQRRRVVETVELEKRIQALEKAQG